MDSLPSGALYGLVSDMLPVPGPITKPPVARLLDWVPQGPGVVCLVVSGNLV